MFGISFGEILFILLIALIILGPKHLAHILSKFWLYTSTLKAQFALIKSDLYAKGGITELKGFENTLTNTYLDLKHKITKDLNTTNAFILNEDILYQPELDFERQPELFDEIGN